MSLKLGVAMIDRVRRAWAAVRRCACALVKLTAPGAWPEVLVVLLCLNGLHLDLGCYSSIIVRIAAWAGLTGLMALRLRLPVRLVSWRTLLGGAILYAGPWGLVFGFDRPAVWVACVPVVLVGIGRIMTGLGSRLESGRLVISGSVLFSTAVLVADSVPIAWQGMLSASRFWSQFVLSAFDCRVVLGPSVSGAWPLAAALCLAVAGLFSRAWRVRSIPAIALLALLHAIFLFLVARGKVPRENAVDVARLPMIFGLASATLMSFILSRRVDEDEGRGTPSRAGLVVAGTSCVFIFATGTALMLGPETLEGRNSGRSILVYEKGYLDWKAAVYGRYGPFSGGMFGLMPRYLELEGYEMAKSDAEELTADNLRGHSTLVLINAGTEYKRFSHPEQKTIWDFVSQGGSLLVLGDHTDVFGIQANYNSLLERVGIRFEFDSAYPCQEGWSGCSVLQSHPLSAGLEKGEECGVAIGASLTIRPPAFPVLVGRYAFSDEGYRQNVMGSFLGNYKYEEAEPAGDMVLVAAAYYGRGKVLVFGDTSSFQNGGWFSGLQPFNHNVFKWLTSRTREPFGYHWPSAIAALLCFALGAAYLSGSWGFRNFLIPVALLAGVACGEAISDSRVHWRPLRGQVALFDYAHMPRTSTDAARFTGIGGLIVNLERLGYLPLMADEIDKATLSECQVLATIAPVRPYNRREVRHLLSFMQSGGVIVAACGYHDQGGLEPLLEEVGLALENIPLGSVPYRRSSAGGEPEPGFVDCYPIRSRSESTGQGEVVALYRFGDHVLAVYRRWGSGGLLFVGDSRFFLSGNLEGAEWGYKEGNILFIKRVFEDLVGAHR